MAKTGLPVAKSLRALFDHVTELIRKGEIVSAQRWAWAARLKPCSRWGWATASASPLTRARRPVQALLRRLRGRIRAGAKAEHLLGRTTEDYALTCRGERVDCEELESIYDAKLEDVFPVRAAQGEEKVEAFRFGALLRRRLP